MPIPQGKKRKKKEGKREGNKGRRNTRKNHMGSKNIEEKFNVKISYSLENNRKRLKIPYIKPYEIDKPIDADLGRLKGVKVFFMDKSGISHDPSRVCMLLGLIIQVLMF